MAHHRCTACKQESYPRHKWYGGVYCDDCIRAIRGKYYGVKRGFFGRIWDSITDFVTRLFKPSEDWKKDRQREQRQVITRMKAMESKARRVSLDPQTLNPQKR